MKQFLAMVYARNMEFFRDRGTLIWNLLMPVVLVIGFSFIFPAQGSGGLFKVGTFGPIDDKIAFASFKEISFQQYDPAVKGQDKETVLNKLRRHQLDMVIDFDTHQYYFNTESKNTTLLRKLFTAYSGPSADIAQASNGYSEQRVSGDPVRYVDWFVPGVIGMNVMFSCLFGVGIVIVRYRKNGVLKRLKATPVSPLAFVAAQGVSRFFIVILTSIVVYTGTNIFLGFMMKGSYLNLLLLTAVAIIAMLSIGLAFATRIKSEELANGLINLLTLPMLFLSGVFFSLEGSPQFLQDIVTIFPLSHFVDGARAIMIEGAGLVDILPHILYLAGTAVVFMIFSAFTFKWE